MPRMLVIGWEQGCSCSCTTRMLGAALALEKAQVLGSVFMECASRQGMPARQPLNRNRFVVCSCCYRVTDATTDRAMCSIRPRRLSTHAFFIIHLSAS